jgi:predicted oxidoreductase
MYFATQTKSINAIWWNCRSGRKLKSEGKIVDFGLSNFTNSQTELIRQKTISFNQVQFSANFEPMVDGSFDYMQLNKIQCLGIR